MIGGARGLRAALAALALLAGPAAAQAGDDLPWSASPGAFERHLQRKVDNPLFPLDERWVTLEQLRAAQARDRADAEALRGELDKLIDAVGRRRAGAAPQEMFAVLSAVFELRRQAAGIGGPAERVAGALEALRRWLYHRLRARLAEDPEGLRALLRIYARHEAVARVVTDPFVAQMQRTDGPISEAEAAATLLSEPPEAIRRFASLLEDDARRRFHDRAERLAERVGREGAGLAGLAEKLAALE